MDTFVEIAIANKDVFTTLILLWVGWVVIIPMFKSMLRVQTKQNEALVGEVRTWFKDITNALVVHMDDDKQQFSQIVKSVQDMELTIWKNVPLSNEATIELAKKFVWAAWTVKLDFIKQRLEKNNLVAREDRIKSQIKAELIRISTEEYITPLNKYNTKVWLLGTWVGNNFPMDEFLEEIYEVIFREDSDIDRKLSDITTLMKSYQNELWSELRILLNS